MTTQTAMVRVEQGAGGMVRTADVDRWNAEMRATIKKQLCPPTMTDMEFALFEETCARTGLDPLQGQCFAVPRKVKVGEQYVDRVVFQPSESGMLARAEMFPDFRGCQAAPVFQADVEAGRFKLNRAQGTVEHEEVFAKNRGELLGAWGRVERVGRTATVVWVPLHLVMSTYRDGNPMGFWAKPGGKEHMVTKCARVAALRTAYPSRFGGLYIAEETPPDDEPEDRRPAHVKAEASAVSTVAAAAAASAAASPAPAVQAPSADLVESLKASLAMKQKQEQAAAPKPAPTPDPAAPPAQAAPAPTTAPDVVDGELEPAAAAPAADAGPALTPDQVADMLEKEILEAPTRKDLNAKLWRINDLLPSVPANHAARMRVNAAFGARSTAFAAAR